MARILIIDDEDVVREMLHQILEDAGYEVLECSDAREALERHCQEDIDLLVIDIQIPRQSAPAIVEELRRDRPGVKVVVICNYVPHISAAIRKSKPDFVFFKPFRMADFLGAVEKLAGSAG